MAAKPGKWTKSPKLTFPFPGYVNLLVLFWKKGNYSFHFCILLCTDPKHFLHKKQKIRLFWLNVMSHLVFFSERQVLFKYVHVSQWRVYVCLKLMCSSNIQVILIFCVKHKTTNFAMHSEVQSKAIGWMSVENRLGKVHVQLVFWELKHVKSQGPLFRLCWENSGMAAPDPSYMSFRTQYRNLQALWTSSTQDKNSSFTSVVQLIVLHVVCTLVKVECFLVFQSIVK